MAMALMGAEDTSGTVTSPVKGCEPWLLDVDDSHRQGQELQNVEQLELEKKLELKAKRKERKRAKRQKSREKKAQEAALQEGRADRAAPLCISEQAQALAPEAEVVPLLLAEALPAAPGLDVSKGEFAITDEEISVPKGSGEGSLSKGGKKPALGAQLKRQLTSTMDTPSAALTCGALTLAMVLVLIWQPVAVPALATSGAVTHVAGDGTALPVLCASSLGAGVRAAAGTGTRVSGCT